MWLQEISPCSCLTVLPGPASVLLSKTNKPFYPSVIVNFSFANMHQYPKFFPCDCSASTQVRFMFQVNACIECELLVPSFGRLPLIVSFACARYLGEASETEYTHGHGDGSGGQPEPEPACGRKAGWYAKTALCDRWSRNLENSLNYGIRFRCCRLARSSSSSSSIFGVVIFPLPLLDIAYLRSI